MAMAATRVTHRVAVADRTEEFVWFSILADDSDIEVPIPVTSPKQSATTERTLRKLAVGDTCRVTFVDANGRRTAWYAGSVSVLPA